MATREEIMNLLIRLADTFGEPQSKPAGYYLALDEYEPDVLDQVHDEAVKALKWYPKPSELREIAQRIQAGSNETERVHREYFRMCQLFGDIAAGRRDDKRAWNACAEYFGITDRAIAAEARASDGAGA